MIELEGFVMWGLYLYSVVVVVAGAIIIVSAAIARVFKLLTRFVAVFWSNRQG